MNAKHDENGIPTLIAVLNTDGQTIQTVQAVENGHRLKVSNGDTGSDLGNPNSQMDDNHVPCIMAVSSVDGVTPVAVYADSNGNLLVKTT